MAQLQVQPLAAAAGAATLSAEWIEPLDDLRQAFGVEFALLDSATGELLIEARCQPPLDFSGVVELCRQVALRGRPEFVADEDVLAILAIPLPGVETAAPVALSAFVTQPAASEEALHRIAQRYGWSSASLSTWFREQRPRDPEMLIILADATVARWQADARAKRWRGEVEQLSRRLGTAYEEISLLYQLTQNLRISASAEALGQLALEWLAAAIPAEALLLELLPPKDEQATPGRLASSRLLSVGQPPIDHAAFRRILKWLQLDEHPRPVVINPAVHPEMDWPLPEVGQLILAPLLEGDNLFGWLAAVNHCEGQEFGSTESTLLSSVAAILGIHSGNRELYRQQAEFLAQVVRALTSAIDAKDPYTCGHSDRVARVSVRLAAELGCGKEQLDTLYLSGLLHDIGKIGIDDNVLRKPGKLTEAEYEHIKLHTEIGYRILQDLKQLGPVLPVVRHHHESWDGTGYPMGLRGEEIPFLARIVAVADAFDAMSSDRPYRSGMPDEKIDAIFRAGAGQQWDAAVVAAFFRARDDIREIARRNGKHLPADVRELA